MNEYKQLAAQLGNCSIEELYDVVTRYVQLYGRIPAQITFHTLQTLLDTMHDAPDFPALKVVVQLCHIKHVSDATIALLQELTGRTSDEWRTMLSTAVEKEAVVYLTGPNERRIRYSAAQAEDISDQLTRVGIKSRCFPVKSRTS